MWRSRNYAAYRAIVTARGFVSLRQDSRVRGNDGIERGSGGIACGNDGIERGNDDITR